MRKSNLTANILAVLAVLTVAPATAQKKNAPKPEVFSVVKVDEEVQVVKKSELKALRARVDRNYKQAVADYKAAVKAARKSKAKVTDPKPKKARIKVLKPTCKTRAEADAFVASLTKKDTKKDTKRAGKKRPKKTDKKAP